MIFFLFSVILVFFSFFSFSCFCHIANRWIICSELNYFGMNHVMHLEYLLCESGYAPGSVLAVYPILERVCLGGGARKHWAGVEPSGGSSWL